MTESRTYKVLIVDDETDAQLILKEFISRYCSNVEIVGAASTIIEAKECIGQFDPDILLLDISLKEGTGFDLLESIQSEHDFQVIFTTAYDQHALKAFKVRAVDYLLKPIDPMDLKESIERCCENISLRDQVDELNKILNKHAYEKITIPSNNAHVVTNLIDIIRCESDGNYTKFHFNNRAPILVAKTLKEFDLMLQYSDFLRVHQSHLINKKHIVSFHSVEGTITLSNDERIPVSRRKKSILLKELNAQLLK